MCDSKRPHFDIIYYKSSHTAIVSSPRWLPLFPRVPEIQHWLSVHIFPWFFQSRTERTIGKCTYSTHTDTESDKELLIERSSFSVCVSTTTHLSLFISVYSTNFLVIDQKRETVASPDRRVHMKILRPPWSKFVYLRDEYFLDLENVCAKSHAKI